MDFTGGCRPQIQLHLGLRPPDPLQLGGPRPSHSLQRMQQRNQVAKPLQEFGGRSSLCRALGRSLQGAEGFKGATPQGAAVPRSAAPGGLRAAVPFGKFKFSIQRVWWTIFKLLTGSIIELFKGEYKGYIYTVVQALWGAAPRVHGTWR